MIELSVEVSQLNVLAISTCRKLRTIIKGDGVNTGDIKLLGLNERLWSARLLNE